MWNHHLKIVLFTTLAKRIACTHKISCKDLAPHIRVNGVSPGAIMWPESDSSKKKKLDIISKIPMRSTGEPLDIAKTFTFY